MNKKISVLMSTYNEKPEDVKTAITSILNQTYCDIEFIIVCDRPDNYELLQILEQFQKEDSRIIIIRNQENLGLSTSLNVALSYASGEYIARMDADDESLPERLEKQLAYLNAHDLDLIGCYVECVNEQKETIYFLKSMPLSNDEVKKKITTNNPMVHPTWLGKREVFVRNNGYHQIPYAEDYDFLFRAVKQGFQLGNLNQSLLRYTVRKSSISNSNGLKQYLVSQALVQAYKNDQYHLIERETFQHIFQSISHRDEEKYAKASAYFMQALTDLSQHRISFINNIMKACFISKYYFKKMLGYLKVFM